MLLYLIIWLFKPIHIDSAVSLRSRNNLQSRNVVYKISKPLYDDDDESIRKHDLTNYNLQNRVTDRLEYNGQKKRLKSNYKTQFTTVTIEAYHELGVFTQFTDKQTSRSTQIRDISNIGTDYNYDYLLSEYYEESIHDTNSNLTYGYINKEAAESGLQNLIRRLFGLQNNSCAEGEIGFKCLFRDYETGIQPIATCLQRLWKIIRIWFFVYLAFAIPLWCTRGLCCCCLFCKFFKPNKTIEEAKSYFITNPPGLLKTTKGHEVLYEPTKSERNSYEEFEHLIRTI